MVHADASTFAEGISKQEAYKQVLEQAQALIDGQRNWVRSCNAHDSGPKLIDAQGLVCVPNCSNREHTLKSLFVSCSNLANTASLLWYAYQSLPSPSREVNWAGFYVLDPTTPSQLILGPFQGRVACQTISFARGVCGIAASSQQVQLVPDVEKFPGHIACDGASRSEIVVPIVVRGRTVGVIDVDCAIVNGFDEVDKQGLESLAQLLGSGCDW